MDILVKKNELENNKNQWTDETIEYIWKHYPNAVPIYVDTKVELKKKKWIMWKDYTLGQAIMLIRKGMNIKETEAVFCEIDKKIYTNNKTVKWIYDQVNPKDKVLILKISLENAFGADY